MKRRTHKLDTNVEAIASVVRLPRRQASKDLLPSRGLSASALRATTRPNRSVTRCASDSRLLQVVSTRCDVGAAVVQLTDELLSASAPDAEAASDSLDRLRRSLGAIEARVWVLDGTQARCALRTGSGAVSIVAPLLHDEEQATIQRGAAAFGGHRC